MLQLNGIVGGSSPISVGAGKTILLQQILIRVKSKQKLILRDINFLFHNKAKNSRSLSRSDSWHMTFVRR
ncbi:hypothetical protein [Paenibacillus sp. V4I5]|uniref:hypothetical protein n=1 Tax=Paenibacillus sp. V4I5 TaxID=3042306 RepID=UPI00279008AC|nr:hypothetical protein [Paenibacillus sp. V4I5]MDQ0918786.1 Ni2+-binding GTPase involved in maturation of urease and hydrogenase [Paenibacillus sp. V4I5]